MGLRNMARTGPHATPDDVERRADADLVAAWREGDGKAAEALVRRHQQAVYRLMLRATGDPAAADDLTQKTFLKALDRVDRLRGEGAFQAWLMRIALNFARSRGRGLFRWRRAPEPVLAELPTAAAPPDEALDRARNLARIRAGVEKLPRRQRQIVQLRLQAELPFKAIAEIVGTTEASAKVTYHNAVRALRARIEERR
jgi:RNA polymerase sigma-70 factor, ECF subfamily